MIQAREPRVPIYVAITVRPGLADCWTRNLSEHGVALVGALVDPRRPPTVGQELDLEWSLPELPTLMRGRGRVQWVTQAAGRGELRERVAVGIRFVEVLGETRAALARFVTEYLPRVVLTSPDERELRLCEQLLAMDAHLSVVHSASELGEAASRGDLAAVVIFSADERRALDLVDVLAPTDRARAEPLAAPRPHVLFASAASPEQLVQLHNKGRIFYSLPRPVDPAALERALRLALEQYAMESQLYRIGQEWNVASSRELTRMRPRDEGPGARRAWVGESAAMREAMALVDRVAPHRVPVLLLGETGTGKELLARAVHDHSDRAAAVFVAQDCGALTETLLESELFGHVRGAFTGAVADHLGLFQICHGGTIFLDEIENLPPSLQAKFLRVLESGEIRPVGSNRPRRVDARVVAATNRDLLAEVRAGRFRADLYYRLNRFPISIPPLRERQGDLAQLVRHLCESIAPELGFPLPEVTPEAQALLEAHAWPGNVRELRNALERAALLAGPGAPITPRTLPPELSAGRKVPAAPRGAGLKKEVQRFERELLRQALQAHEGVVRRAARALGTSPVTFSRKARAHGLLSPAAPGDPAAEG
jgi:two-component system response regulator HupR/HoxA